MAISPRENALRQIVAGHRQPQLSERPIGTAPELFGRDVFSLRLMRERLPKEVFKRLKEVNQHGGRLDPSDADVVASSMKDWALERGATHYTHWFQPMTGQTAEKHDAFMTPTPDGQVITEFSGRMLISGEPDASSFPSGGLRSTFEARGYTAWDPTSPAFILGGGLVRTLYIPTVFYAYTGEALDRKTPLLRSVDALARQVGRLLALLGQEGRGRVEPMIGVEQEYFLVDRRLYLRRPDLMMCGRTLYGARASKGQDLEDHYFGAIPNRALKFMQDVEQRLLALGIPVHTRHNEAAPAQFEVAPVYEKANIATDHNMLIMEVLRQTAEEHDLACLLHEKPFAGVNGSGKHNNWSLGDEQGHNLLEPGKDPWDNLLFLVLLAAVMRGAHLHATVLRLGIVGAGNDHRLGASEAPPAIISIYIGQMLEQVIDGVIAGCRSEKNCPASSPVELGLGSLPALQKDTADRNRTSPFAFTGNKFEFRALGSSQSTATINIVLNAAVADALDDIVSGLERETAAGRPVEEAVWAALPGLFKEHRAILFNGDNYSAEWTVEAERRGLPNFKDSVAALERYNRPEVMGVFERQKVFSAAEMLSRQNILFGDYTHRLLIEAHLTLNLGRTNLWPSALAWQERLGHLALQAAGLAGDEGAEKDAYLKVRRLNEAFHLALNGLEVALAEFRGREISNREAAVMARDRLLPAMLKCREAADQLEELVDARLWPLPSYAELFWLY